MIKYEGNIFQRIFKRLKNIFVKTKEEQVEEVVENVEQKVELKDVVGCEVYKPDIEIAVLAKRLEKKEIAKEDLTDAEKEKVIEYYKKNGGLRRTAKHFNIPSNYTIT